MSFISMRPRCGIIYGISPGHMENRGGYQHERAYYFAYSIVANIGPEYEAVRMFLDDPMGIIYTQPLFP